VEETCNGSTLGARNPKVGRTCVQDNLECLSRSSEADLCVILRIHKVGKWDIVTAVDLLLGPEKRLTVLGVRTSEIPASTTDTKERGLLLTTILLREVSGLKSMVPRDGRDLMQLKLVNATCSGEGEQTQEEGSDS
jgi:hypothetical protein